MTGTRYPTVDEITEYQRDKISEVRSRLGDLAVKYPEILTDFTILRWLMGWDYSVDVIIPKILNSIEVPRSLKLQNLPLMTYEEVNIYMITQYPSLKYFPGGIMSEDREGNLVYYHAFGHISPKTIMKCMPMSQLFKACITEAELMTKLIRANEAKNNRKLACKVVVDFDGFSMEHLYTQLVQIYLVLATISQDLYADYGRVIYIINQPRMMAVVYAIISPVLSKQSKEKIKFLGDNWRAVLCDDFGPENVYPEWGGTKPVPENPNAYLTPGGPVPKELWYDAKSNPVEGKLITLIVNARSKELVRIEGKKGQKLKWFFRVNSGDIDFSVESDDHKVYPVLRSSTYFHPEMDSIICEHGGEYRFVFSNEHALIFSKEIKYFIELID